MKDRISQLIKALGITNNAFAIEIGVQRANITHIMNGRSGPSLDFIDKLIKKYPSVNIEWLMTGNGKMFKQAITPSLFPDTTVEPTINPPINKYNEVRDEPQAIYETKRPPKESKEKVIEKIVVFYTDKTFELYNSL